MTRRQQIMRSRSLRSVAVAILTTALAGPVGDAQAQAAELLQLETPDGRRVRLFDDFTWEYVQGAPASDQGTLVLRLERKVDAPRGCRFGLRLTNRARYKVVSLVPQISAYDPGGVPTDTVYVSFQGIKPTLDQYREIQFRGIACADIARLELHGGDRCSMGDLDRFTAEKGACLARVSLDPNEIFPISK